MAAEGPVEADVVVVGSGGAAMTAAVTAGKAGLKVVVVEKSPFIGGTTALSGGIAWLPLNAPAAELGRGDTRDAAELYLRSLMGDTIRPDMLRAYLDNAPRLVDFLHSKTAMRFEVPRPYVDYTSDLPGAGEWGRSLTTRVYDLRELGEHVRLLRPPHSMMVVYGGMMFNGADMYQLLNALRSWNSFWYSAKLSARFFLDKLMHGRGMRAAVGNALIARMMRSALDAGVELRVNSPAKELIIESGRVTGVEIEHNGKRERVMARVGVVLGSGGFAHNPELVKRYLPFPERHASMAVDSNEGDGAHMAAAAGGHIGEGGYHNYLGMPLSAMKHRDGRIEKCFWSPTIRAKPGLIAVDMQGKRFVNEALAYNNFIHVMAEKGVAPGWFIADHRYLRSYGFGLVRPGPAWMRPLGSFIESGFLVTAPTIAELARKIGVPPQNLEETVRRYNELMQSGKDSDFRKGETAHDKSLGDPANKPHPNLRPADQPPYYAIQFEPGNLGTFAGIETDASARVLNQAGQPVEGLYACGLDMLNCFSGNYPGGGGSIGPGMVFGFIAGQHLVERSKATVGQGESRSSAQPARAAA